MRKPCLIAIAALCFIPGAVHPLHAADSDALLAKEVPFGPGAPKNYDEMVANIKKTTGMKVEIDPELAAVMRKVSVNGWPVSSMGGDYFPDTTSLEYFLNYETRFTCLRWELDGGAIRLIPVWKKDDNRGAGELLTALRKAYAVQSNTPQKKNDIFTTAWMDARKPCGLLLNALLSKKENYDKALQARMMGLFKPESDGCGVFAGTPDIFFIGDFAKTDGRRGVIVLLRHPCLMSPGEGDLSYYFFTPDGRLDGAGLLCCGSGCNALSASVKKARPGEEFPDLLVKVNQAQYEDFQEKYVMQPDSLVITEVLNPKNVALTASEMEGWHMGESRMGDAQ